MLVRIDAARKNYSWGSTNLLPDYFHSTESAEKIAELWFSTHPLGQATCSDDGQKLGDRIGSLPYLVKILGVASPLSIQVHPTADQAREGFEREEQAGIEVSSPLRNYKDGFAKPELLIALNEFRALCGLRKPAQIAEIFRSLTEVDPTFTLLAKEVEKPDGLRLVFSKLLDNKELAAILQSRLSELSLDGVTGLAAQIAAECFKNYPGDPGGLVSLMLNPITLKPNQAIFLPAGQLHAYLEGVGLEVMAPSDNVIRGGLTSKHIDKEELLKIASFSPLSEVIVEPISLAHGLWEYRTEAKEFSTYRFEVGSANLLADIELKGSASVVCLSGEIAVSTSAEEREVIKKSEAVVFKDARSFSISGSGSGFLVL